MTGTLESLGIDRMSVGDRFDLIEEIWSSLPEQVSMEEVPGWHLTEVTRRREEACANPGVGRPFREVLGESNR